MTNAIRKLATLLTNLPKVASNLLVTLAHKTYRNIPSYTPKTGTVPVKQEILQGVFGETVERPPLIIEDEYSTAPDLSPRELSLLSSWERARSSRIGQSRGFMMTDYTEKIHDLESRLAAAQAENERLKRLATMGHESIEQAARALGARLVFGVPSDEIVRQIAQTIQQQVTPLSALKADNERLTAALEQETAKRMKAEFWRCHDEHDPENCLECETVKTVEGIDILEGHDWQDSDWLAVARQALRGEK